MKKGMVPEGQPTPRPRTKLHDSPHGKLPSFVFPWEVVNIRKKSDLELALEHYGHPFPQMESSNAVRTPQGFRHLVEWVFPALRWYCRVYGEEIPSWLEGNGFADHLSKDQFAKYFGKHAEPLEVREWREDKSKQGKRA